MADENEEKKEPQAEVEEEKTEQPEKKTEPQEMAKQSSGTSGVAVWIILAGIIIASAGAGLGAAKIFARSSLATKPQTEQTQPEPPPRQQESLNTDNKDSEQVSWSINMEPVVASLKEPRVDRYVRVTLTLEMSPEAQKDKTEQFIKNNTAILRNWLTIYLADLTLEDVSGRRNLKRIQAEILDGFNELLFPDAKPLIVRVLFNEFAIQ